MYTPCQSHVLHVYDTLTVQREQDIDEDIVNNKNIISKQISVVLYNDSSQKWHVLTRDHTVLDATHTFIHQWNMGRRLSRFGSDGWLRYQGGMPAHPSTNWAWCTVTLLIENNMLPHDSQVATKQHAHWPASFDAATISAG